MKYTHIRRCHVCGTVNEAANSAVHKCHICGKHLAPFYYFDESKLDGLKEGDAYLSTWKQSPSFNPIYGLSSYWQESNESPVAGHT
jgi:hypothetical protein